MPKTQVREAIAAFLDPSVSNIPSLGAVYQALPKVANEEDLFQLQPAGTGTGAVIYVFITNQSEKRAALGGANSGKKIREYEVSLLCILKSDLETSLAGQEAFDTMIDALTARVQSDRTAGTDGDPIFQWGEGTDVGAPDIRFEYPVPRTAHGGVVLFQAVGRVTALEFLTT